MTISRDDASHALGEVESARGRVREAIAYGFAWPYFVLWGLAWMIADVGTEVAPPGVVGWIWPVTSLVFTSVAIVYAFVQHRRSPYVGAGRSWRPLASAGTIMLFLVALTFVISPLDAKRMHSIFGLFFGFAYILQGLWLGWRLVVLGAVLVALTLFAFYALPLWGGYLTFMGVAGGGALALGGLWLRKL
jgi:hypothetical protein